MGGGGGVVSLAVFLARALRKVYRKLERLRVANQITS